MEIQRLSTLYHCTYSLHDHLVLVTRYRKRCISAKMLARLEEIFGELCTKWEGELVEFSREADHVHLLVSLTPKTGLTKFVNTVKTVPSRLIRKEFSQEVDQHDSKRVFWSRSYCVVTCDGAPLSVSKQYIEGQDAPS